MGRRGRKPDPPELRVLKANKGRPSAGPFASTRLAGDPPKPATIGDDPVASAEWDRVASMLVDRRVLSPADMAVLACYCSAWSTVDRCRRILQPKFDPETSDLLADPFICDTAAGGIKIHPAVNALSAAERSLVTFASELGLSPSARGRVTTLEDVDRPKSKLSAYL